MRAISVVLLLSVLAASTLLTCDQKNGQGDDDRRGYVLKAGNGEKVFDSIIMASPETGTQGGV